MRVFFLLLPVFLWSCATTRPEAESASQPSAGTPAATATTATGAEIRMDSDLVTASLDVGGDADSVWQALLAVYEEMEIGAVQVNETARLVRNPKLVVSRRLAGERLSEFVDCGRGATGSNANTHRLELDISSRVRALGPGESRVETELSGTGMNVEGTSNSRVTCTSTHALEVLITAKVRARVGAGEG